MLLQSIETWSAEYIDHEAYVGEVMYAVVEAHLNAYFQQHNIVDKSEIADHLKITLIEKIAASITGHPDVFLLK